MTDSCALVAGLARHRGVRAEQREAVLVIFHALRGDIPALHGVALVAIGAHLTAVNVRVTIGAIFPHVGKNRLGVALRAWHLFVHAAKPVIGLVVIEFGNRADGAPAAGGVAVFAGNRQWPVWAAGGLFLRRSGESGRTGSSPLAHPREQEHKQGQEREITELERRQLPQALIEPQTQGPGT